MYAMTAEQFIEAVKAACSNIPEGYRVVANYDWHDRCADRGGVGCGNVGGGEGGRD
jgi:hypothetical protein